MSYYKKLGYALKDYPVTYDNFSREISLPVFYDMTEEQMKMVIDAVFSSVNKLLAGF
jgi:dTDP-4-amino-4,6-dideoxygalactose transaminase